MFSFSALSGTLCLDYNNQGNCSTAEQLCLSKRAQYQSQGAAEHGSSQLATLECSLHQHRAGDAHLRSAISVAATHRLHSPSTDYREALAHREPWALLALSVKTFTAAAFLYLAVHPRNSPCTDPASCCFPLLPTQAISARRVCMSSETPKQHGNATCQPSGFLGLLLSDLPHVDDLGIS